MLQQSAPLINAPEIWNKQVNGIYLTGEGQTVCVVDTGIDYTHSAIGGSSCSKDGWDIDGTQEDYDLEFYAGSADQTWTITKSGYSNIAIHFSNINLLEGGSVIYIKDAQDNIIQGFAKDSSDEWTFSAPGDTIKINFQGPPTYGFTIDKVLDGHAEVIWQNCGDFIGGYDAVDFDHDPMDGNGHGTHVSGIITSDDSTYKGIAPDANIIAVKALDDDGWGWDEDIIGGIDGCIRYADLYNISVISLSLGGDTLYGSSCDGSSSYTSFINKAADNNILVVAATGNDYSTSQICEPACVNKATPVGSIGDGSGTTPIDQISSFSNRWSNPMVFAPGDLIYSTKLNGGFENKQGTSMSTPHVSGVAALIYQYADLKGIEITPQEIEELLIEIGKPISGTYTRVDALAAIEELQKIFINISLNQGWNLISIPLILQNNSVKNVFSGISYSNLLYYDSVWKNATEINNTFGYWIKSDDNAVLTVEGLPPEDITINLDIGWNLIGHPYLEEKNISELFINNATVYSYNGTWSSYITGKAFNLLQTLRPGYGYWVKTD